MRSAVMTATLGRLLSQLGRRPRARLLAGFITLAIIVASAATLFSHGRTATVRRAESRPIAGAAVLLPISLPPLPTPPPPPPPVAPAPVAVPVPVPERQVGRLIISRIGVDAAIESVGVAPDGSMGIPATWDDVAWYNGAVQPGLPGDSAIDGHLDSTTGPAVFWRIHELRAGDQVVVVFDDGLQRTFRVTGSHTLVAGSIVPLGRGGVPRLMLITCSGTWLRGQHQYSQRLVIDTVLVS